MEKVKDKEALKKRLYVFTLAVIRLCAALPKKTAAKVIGKQLLRSATSILANYAQERPSNSKKDHLSLVQCSLDSSNETKIRFALLSNFGNCPLTDANMLLKKTDEIAKILPVSILTMGRGRDA